LLAPLVLLAVALGEPQTPATPGPLPNAPPLGSSWGFVVEPLLWLPSLEGHGSTDGGSNVDLDRSFADTFGELDAGFLLAFEARAPESRFTLLGDGLYVRFRDDEGGVQTRTEVTMIEAGFGVPLRGTGFEPIAGLRYVALSLDVDLGSTVDARAEHGWVDPWIGARWQHELFPGWTIALRGDIGGFGVGSDFTWQALADLRIALGDHWWFDIGYRALSVDFDDDDLGYDALAHGPQIGLAFHW